MAIQFDNTNTGVATLRPATSGTIALTLPSADGTSGQALTTNGSGQLAFTTVGGGGGLTGFTAAESTAAPNATVNVDSLTASAASTDADVAFVAKGAGATLAQVPDSTTTGGNKRGQYATDWQKSRSAATEVASGSYSVIGGGDSNISSNSFSTIAGGGTNTSSAAFSTVGGGANNQATGSYATVGGGQTCTATASHATVAGGLTNVANSNNSFVAGGRHGSARSIVGYTVFPASLVPIASASGVQQLATLLLGRQTTDATATVLTSNTSAAATTNQVILPNNSAYYFRGSIVAGVTGGANSAMWSFEGGIERGANAASTTIIQSVINPVAADAGASSWIVALSSDTTNGGLAVTVTGAAATTIRWVCKIETTEMTF